MQSVMMPNSINVGCALRSYSDQTLKGQRRLLANLAALTEHYRRGTISLLAAYRDSPPRLLEAERANVWALLARLARGGTQLFFFFSFLLSPHLANRVALRLGALVWWQGRRNSIPLWRRASLPTGHGARRRRVGEPQQSKRLAANELRADARTKSMDMEYSTC